MRLFLEPLEDRITPADAYTVSNLGDAGQGQNMSGDLRWCINQVNGANPLSHVIDFSVSGTISLQSALPALQKNVKINGPGASTITVQGNASAQTPYSIFVITKGVTAEIDGLTIQGGYNSNGGGILNDGQLTLQNDVIQSNTATMNGGGIASGANNGATLSLENDTIKYNTAAAGGGIYNDDTLQSYLEQDTSLIIYNTALEDGGGIYNLGTVNFFGAGESINNNQANVTTGDGGGVYNGYKATFTLSSGFINDNDAFKGGGLFNAGTATLQGATQVESNSANQGGGIYLMTNSSTTFNNVTVSGNQLNGDNPIAKGVGYVNPCTMDIISLTDNDDPMGDPVKIGG